MVPFTLSGLLISLPREQNLPVTIRVGAEGDGCDGDFFLGINIELYAAIGAGGMGDGASGVDLKLGNRFLLQKEENPSRGKNRNISFVAGRNKEQRKELT